MIFSKSVDYMSKVQVGVDREKSDFFCKKRHCQYAFVFEQVNLLRRLDGMSIGIHVCHFVYR